MKYSFLFSLHSWLLKHDCAYISQEKKHCSLQIALKMFTIICVHFDVSTILCIKRTLILTFLLVRHLFSLHAITLDWIKLEARKLLVLPYWLGENHIESEERGTSTGSYLFKIFSYISDSVVTDPDSFCYICGIFTIPS